MSVTVRSATESDLDAAVALNMVVQDLHVALYPRDFNAVVDPAGAATWFAARLSEPNNVIAIAELDATPVGYVWFERQTRPETLFAPSRRRIYLHHLSVGPKARRRGVATALLHFVEQFAIAEGMTDIVLDTWAANADAQAFFTARGFAPRQMVFQKALESAS
jgi:ribosomal protein S18 acetylase RimI-like enzyme